jgi:hypothetical protein
MYVNSRQLKVVEKLKRIFIAAYNSKYRDKNCIQFLQIPYWPVASFYITYRGENFEVKSALRLNVLEQIRSTVGIYLINIYLQAAIGDSYVL